MPDAGGPRRVGTARGAVRDAADARVGHGRADGCRAAAVGVRETPDADAPAARRVAERGRRPAAAPVGRRADGARARAQAHRRLRVAVGARAARPAHVRARIADGAYAAAVGAAGSELSLARDSAEQWGDLELRRFFQHKLGEEHGHDQWAESDLKEMGAHFGSSVGATREPCRAILALVRDLERAIRVAPASYLAYILFAEYITVLMGPVWVDALREHCGVPADALSVVSRHAELDREHVAECVAEFDALLAASDAPRAFDTLRVAMSHFEAFCDELHALARTGDAA